jgi:hypothetical protein
LEGEERSDYDYDYEHEHADEYDWMEWWSGGVVEWWSGGVVEW